MSRTTFTKLPPIPAGKAHQGCLCCPIPSAIASMDKGIAVGFGSAIITRDGKHFYDGERDYQDGGEPLNIGHIEALARQDPDHDWRAEFYGPLHGEVYQRQGDAHWVMVESNMGFA